MEVLRGGKQPASGVLLLLLLTVLPSAGLMRVSAQSDGKSGRESKWSTLNAEALRQAAGTVSAGNSDSQAYSSMQSLTRASAAVWRHAISSFERSNNLQPGHQILLQQTIRVPIGHDLAWDCLLGTM